MVSWWALWVGDRINFRNSFFVKNYYLNLNLFQVLQSAILKNKSSQKRRKPPKNFLTQKRKKKNIEKGEKKTTNEKSQQQLTFSYCYFFIQKNFYFVRKHIWKNVCFILLHMYYNFSLQQVIGNAVIKHQRSYRYSLVLQTPYFDPKYLVIDQVFQRRL